METLEKRNEKNAALTVRERVALCESCDMLNSKNLKELKPESLQKIVTITKEAWKLFPLHVEFKLAHHYFLASIFPPALECIDADDEREKEKGFTMISSALQLSVGDEETKFHPLSPSFSGAFNSLVKQIADAMEKAGFLKKPDDSEFTFGIEEAVPDPKRAEKLQAELKPLQASIEELALSLQCQ